MSKEIITLDYNFRGPLVPKLTPAAAGTGGPWVGKDTSAAGTVVIAASGGFMNLTLDSQAEAQNACLYWDDDLALDIDDLVQVDIWAKLTASLGAAVSAAWGLASARNDAIDSIAAQTLFRAIGNNTVVVESDDGVTDKDDISSGGLTLSTTVRRFCLEFKEGIHTQSPPSLPTGGKSNVLYSMENSQGLLRRVAETTRFDMSGYSSGLQPFFQLQKTADAAVATLSIQRVRIQLRQN